MQPQHLIQSQQETPPKPHYLRPNVEQRDINALMIKLIPELESELTATLMVLNRWYKPEEVLDNGTPCFLPSPQQADIKQDYIWMPKRKDLETGHYHFRTQEAYLEVNHRLKTFRPVSVIGFMLGTSTVVPLVHTKKEKETYRKTRDLIRKRLQSDTPNDIHNARMHLLNVQTGNNTGKAFGRAVYLPTLTTTILLG